jgi:pyrroline-5-carboxylate reductase
MSFQQAISEYRVPLIRCMPNTPAAIGQGMMALCVGNAVTNDARALTETLFGTSGAIAWIQGESLMDAVTAISGSGPAYVFHFVEMLAAAGSALVHRNGQPIAPPKGPFTI